MMGLCGSTPVADKLSSLTSFAYDKKAVWRAMHYLREHTDPSKGDQVITALARTSACP